MNNTIKPGITNQQLPVQLRAKGASTGSAASTQASGSVRSSDDSVQLTDSAKALDAASRSGDIDQAKVDAISSSIANGTYKPDAQAIASKFLAMEGQMGGVGKA